MRYLNTLLLILLLSLSAVAQAIPSERYIDDWRFVTIPATKDRPEVTFAATYSSSNAQLSVQCSDDNRLMAFFMLHERLPKDKVEIIFYVDRNSDSTLIADVMPNRAHAYTDDARFMRQLEAGRKLTVRWRREFGPSSPTVVFSLRGYYDATGLLNCGS